MERERAWVDRDGVGWTEQAVSSPSSGIWSYWKRLGRVDVGRAGPGEWEFKQGAAFLCGDRLGLEVGQ